MCILRFHARAGCLQTYETLLKQLSSLQGSDKEQDQYAVDCVAPADRNFNVPCESGIRYPSLIAIMNSRRQMMWRKAVMCHNVCVHILPCTLYIVQYTQLYMVYTLLTWYFPRPTQNIVLAAYALISTFSNQAGLNLHRILHPVWHCQTEKHPPQRGWSTHIGRLIRPCAGCLQSLLRGSGKTCRISWGFQTKLIGCLNQVPVGLQQSSIISFKHM